MSDNSKADIEEALSRLERLPGFSSAKITDPRFDWVRKSLVAPTTKTRTILELCRRTACLPTIVPSDCAALLLHVAEYAEWLTSLKVTEEVITILEALRGRLSLNASKHIITMLGFERDQSVYSFRRNPLLGIYPSVEASSLQKDIRAVSAWAPSCLILTERIKGRVPLFLMDALEGTGSANLPLTNGNLKILVDSLFLFGGVTGIAALHSDSPLVFVDREDTDWIKNLVHLTFPIKIAADFVKAQGVVTRSAVEQRIKLSQSPQPDRVINQLIASEWGITADGPYLIAPSMLTSNAVWTRISKTLSVRPVSALSFLVEQISRDPRVQLGFDAEQLMVFVKHHPDLEIEGQSVRSVRVLAKEDVLSRGERIVLDVLQEADGPMRAADVVNSVGARLSASRVQDVLRSSPIVEPVGRGVYRSV